MEATAFNTAVLLASGVVLYFANRAFLRSERRADRLLLASILLGAFFVVFQGAEWVALIHEGLTLTSGPLGAFFYLLVGTHAAHAVVAVGILVLTYRWLREGDLSRFAFWPAQIFWYFVVGVWPVLYALVYL